MPQFEIEPSDEPPAFARGRTAADALRRHLGADDEPVLGDPEPGTGWQAVEVDGAPWGRVRPRDRMRFRRD